MNKPFIVKGYVVEPAVIEQVEAELKRFGKFSLANARNSLIKLGVPTDDAAADRAADKIVQTLKREGKVEFLGRKSALPWKWVAQ